MGTARYGEVDVGTACPGSRDGGRRSRGLLADIPRRLRWLHRALCDRARRHDAVIHGNGWRHGNGLDYRRRRGAACRLTGKALFHRRRCAWPAGNHADDDPGWNRGRCLVAEAGSSCCRTARYGEGTSASALRPGRRTVGKLRRRPALGLYRCHSPPTATDMTPTIVSRRSWRNPRPDPWPRGYEPAAPGDWPGQPGPRRSRVHGRRTNRQAHATR